MFSDSISYYESFTYLWGLLAEEADGDVAHGRVDQYSFWDISVASGHCALAIGDIWLAVWEWCEGGCFGAATAEERFYFVHWDFFEKSNMTIAPGYSVRMKVGSMMGERNTSSIAYSVRTICPAPLKRRTHVPPLLQGLHSCDSDNKRDATLESDNVQRCCVNTILTMKEVQEASARTSHPCDGCPHVQAALSALAFQMLEQLSLARNIG